jgi:hypothetical protein
VFNGLASLAICDLKSTSGRNENVQDLWLQNKKEKKDQKENQEEKEITTLTATQTKQ